MKNLMMSLCLLLSFGTFAQLSTDQKTLLDKQIEVVKTWASDAVVVNAVKAQNATPSEVYKAMTQDAWKALPVLDSKVRDLSKNAVAEFIKSKKTEAVSEAFVNAADGTKVALLSKTSSWSHATSGKHKDPMANKTWIGEIELDESTGSQQIQVSVPVLDGGKAIGSMVVGFSISKLK